MLLKKIEDKLDQLSTTLEIKEVTEEGEFEGYASTFGDIDNGGDVVMKGAFTESLKKRQPKMLLQHDSGQIIGEWKDLREDDKGLFARGKILKGIGIPEADKAYSLVKAKLLDAMSIGFRTVKASPRGKTSVIREIHEAELWEISLVTFPMNPKAVVTSAKNNLTKRDLEGILRDAGVPNGFAKKLLSGGFDAANQSLVQRDAGSGLADLIRATSAAMKG